MNLAIRRIEGFVVSKAAGCVFQDPHHVANSLKGVKFSENHPST
jgi:hypothetical protein